jgi:predicted RNA-binding protein YlqC (UPF0109 family)
VTDEPVIDREDVPLESENLESEKLESEKLDSENLDSENLDSENEAEPSSRPGPAPAEAAATTDAHQVPAPTATAVLTHVVRSIVDDADAVRVDAVEGRNRLKLEVKVGPGDLGRVIGRRGRTAQSIRTVVRAAATRDGVEVDVDFVD